MPWHLTKKYIANVRIPKKKDGPMIEELYKMQSNDRVICSAYLFKSVNEFIIIVISFKFNKNNFI